MTLRDRHLYGAGAAACAVCCATPVLTLLGVAGAASALASFVFAGVVFGLVVAVGTVLAVWQQRRQRRGAVCAPGAVDGPVDVELSGTRTGRDA